MAIKKGGGYNERVMVMGIELLKREGNDGKRGRGKWNGKEGKEE